MTDPKEKECAACVASRRSVVDSFFLGFRAGHSAAVNALHNGGDGETYFSIEEPIFCLAHDKMMTEAYLAEIKQQLEKGG